MLNIKKVVNGIITECSYVVFLMLLIMAMSLAFIR